MLSCSKVNQTSVMPKHGTHVCQLPQASASSADCAHASVVVVDMKSTTVLHRAGSIRSICFEKFVVSLRLLPFF